MKTNFKTKNLVILGLFSAIEIMLSLTPLGYIPLGFTRATTIHIPVILGGILLGPKAGAILGGVFGMTSIIINTVTPTLTSFVFSPFYAGGNMMSIVVALVPRILIGVVSYYVFRLFAKITKKEGLSYIVAGVIGSMTNTILVMSGIYIFFGSGYATAKEMPVSELFSFVMGVVGINGVPEAIVAGILTVLICKPLKKTMKKTQLYS